MNNYYAKFNENGERETSIVFSVHYATEEELQLYLDQGFEPITDNEQSEYASGKYIRGENGKPVEKTPVVVPLERLKEIKKNQINVERNTREQSVFLFRGKAYDANKDSVQRTSIAAQNALVAKVTGAPFAVNWTLADNTAVTLDADGMLGVSQALATHSATVHGIARELKVLVDAAETPEELESIAWTE